MDKMKIAVTGKGGTGKTLIAGVLAARFAAGGQQVLAIDADPTPNLARSLGLSLEESDGIKPIAANEDLIRQKTGTGFSGVFRLTFTVDDIIRKYAVPTPSGAHLMVMGTVRSVGSGCTCPANSLVRELLRHLITERNEIIILDMEAGIEHLGRGTAEHVDTMLVITDANRKSLDVAATICRMAKEAGIRNVLIVGNRIGTPAEEAVIGSFADRIGIAVAALVPFDREIFDAGITGEPVYGRNTPATREIERLATILRETPP